MIKFKRFKRPMAFIIATALLAGGFINPSNSIKAQAAGRTLTLSAAKSTAIALSEKIEGLDLTLDANYAALNNAIRSVSAKKKNLSTFRWSPLLSFKFPKKPNLVQAYEFQYKPLAAQITIDKTKHRIIDARISEGEKVEQLFVTIVTLERKIETNTERKELLEDNINKNRARLQAGEGTQSDIDRMEKKLESLETSIAADERNLSDAKKKLSKAVGFDVSTGYSFEEPFIEGDIKRNMLNSLIEYTLQRNDTYYSVSLDAQQARASLETNYNLIKGHYSGKYMSKIDSYCRQALAGQKFNAKAFKRSYDSFLTAIDDPWRGSFRILFIKIPKEWFKGDLDGIRFVEDDPYALYTSAMDYISALKEQENTKEEIINEVTNAFNNYVAVKNAYLEFRKNLSRSEEELSRARVLNEIGDMTYAEFEGVLEDFESAQNDLFQGLSDYSSTLYAFDRLTCGGVSALLSGTSLDLGAVGGGVSHVEADIADGAYYYINPIISQSQFVIGVNIPADFDLKITDFELRADGVLIGERTAVDETLRDLTLTKSNVERVALRLYNGDDFVDECEIDAEAYYGPLFVTGDYDTVTEPDNRIGSYTLERSEVSNLSTLKLTVEATDEIKGYRILTSDGLEPLGGPDIIPIDAGFVYLRLVESDLKDLKIEYYGEGDNLLYTGYFNTGDSSINRDPTLNTDN